MARTTLAALIVTLFVATTAATNASTAPGGGKRQLIALTTGGDSELRKVVPITRSRHRERRVVMSLALPTLAPGDELTANAEVLASTTCLRRRSARCIGRPYRFDPRVSVRLVLAQGKHTTGRARSTTLSRRVERKCGQNRPNRNHHCPLVVDNARFEVKSLQDLPCAPSQCRLNYVMSADHRDASGRNVVVVGADRPRGRVAQDKGRVNAVLKRAATGVEQETIRSTGRRVRVLPARFSGGHQVVYSVRLPSPAVGDVFMARARQRTEIGSRYPYFIANSIIVSKSPLATRPSSLAKRSVSMHGTVTEMNGFNCTPGPSAFRSPCVSRKAGIVRIRRTPDRPLYMNLVSRGFPMLAQARVYDSPARVLGGGGIEVSRLRVVEGP